MYPVLWLADFDIESRFDSGALRRRNLLATTHSEHSLIDCPTQVSVETKSRRLAGLNVTTCRVRVSCTFNVEEHLRPINSM